MKRFLFKVAVTAVLALPVLAGAQSFVYNRSGGDVCAGFRKTGSYADPYEAVANFGNFTNFLKLTPGTTMTISNFSPSQLKDCFADGNSNLQWSVWGSLDVDTPTSYGTFPNYTLLFTLPHGTNLSTQTVAPARAADTGQAALDSEMLSCEQGAVLISGFGVSNADNTLYFVRESVALYPNDILTTYIGDSFNTADGDFGGGYTGGFPFDIENVTAKIFNAAQRSDFYLSVPASSDANVGNGITYVDPLTSLTNGPADFIGYFMYSTNGTLTFTRGFAVTASATNGSTPLKVVFSTSAVSTVGATNWVWTFGDGTSITNTTSGNVTNTYVAVGSYTVTLTINGSNGPVTLTLPNYVVATTVVTSTPGFSKVTLAGSQLVFNGTNGMSGTQYRVLMSTNLSLGNWIPVYTNQFSGSGTFSYTNTGVAGPGSFFRLVTP